jgi:hypothetical protein
MNVHVKPTKLEQEIGLPKVKAIEAGLPNPSRFSG